MSERGVETESAREREGARARVCARERVCACVCLCDCTDLWCAFVASNCRVNRGASAASSPARSGTTSKCLLTTVRNLVMTSSH